MDQTASAGCEAEHGYRIINIITPSCNDSQQDAWLTSAHLEVALDVIRKELPYIEDLHLQADNASNYHCTQFLDQAPAVASLSGFHLRSMWHNEPGEGKDLVDAAFNQFKTPARNRISKTSTEQGFELNAPTAVHLACVASMRPPAGMTIVACKTPARTESDSAQLSWTPLDGIKQYFHYVFEEPDWQPPASQGGPSKQLKGITEAELNVCLGKRYCTVDLLKMVLRANGCSQLKGKKAQLQDRLRQVHSEQEGKLRALELLHEGMPQAPPGRPVLVRKHFNFGTGERVHLPLPVRPDGGFNDASLSTGATGISPADAIEPEELAGMNQVAKKHGWACLESGSEAMAGARHTVERIHGAAREQPAETAARPVPTHPDSPRRRKSDQEASKREQVRRDQERGLKRLRASFDTTLPCPNQHLGCETRCDFPSSSS